MRLCISKNLLVFALSVGLLFFLIPSSAVHAATHTWTKSVAPGSREIAQNQTITIIGSRITWEYGFWDTDLTDARSWLNSSLSMANAINSARERAVDLSDACKNPFMSQDLRMATGASDSTTRWLAAQDMFNTIQLKNLWSLYQGAYGSTGIQIIIDGKSYQGFNVKYADGSTEKWVVNPGYRTSVVKLFDTPLPDSLKRATDPQPKC